MSFSVLMSLYIRERPEFLCQSFDSIFLQSLRANEIILVEDGPLTDELYNILDEYKSNHHELKSIKLPANSGLGEALNEGLKHCSHELVIRMDTDDICFPDRFEKQIEFMTKHPEVDISSAWLEEFEGDVTNVKTIKKVPASHSEIKTYIKTRNPLNHPAVIFRKSAVERAGGYKHFPLFEDWYLWARMIQCGARFANIQECLLHFRTSSDMFKRRGGMKYAIDSAKFQWTLHKIGLISSYCAIKASLLRGGVYIMPNFMRRWIYSKLLRS